MGLAEEFPNIVKSQVPLAPYTRLKIGGVADYVAEPDSIEQLSKLIQACKRDKIPFRVLGGGANVLIREQPVAGLIVRLVKPEFTKIEIQGKIVKAGGGANLADVVAQTCLCGLAGFESLVGISATVGGALRTNAGDKLGEVSEPVLRVHVLDDAGQIAKRERSELRFGEHVSDLDDPVILSVEFALENDQISSITKRMRRAWVYRKAEEPLGFTAAVRVFKNPPMKSAASLIVKSNLRQARFGAAEVHYRNPNYIVVTKEATSQDVLGLVNMIRDKVKTETGIVLEQELKVW